MWWRGDRVQNVSWLSCFRLPVSPLMELPIYYFALGSHYSSIPEHRVQGNFGILFLLLQGSELRELVMDREARRAAIHGVTKTRTPLSDWIELNWREEKSGNVSCEFETVWESLRNARWKKDFFPAGLLDQRMYCTVLVWLWKPFSL